jgi:membrane dipeptidase
MALRILDGADPGGEIPGGHLDLPRMRRGGLDGGIFAVWTDPGATGPLEATLERVDRVRERLEATPGVRLVLRASDLEDPAGAGTEAERRTAGRDPAADAERGEGGDGTADGADPGDVAVVLGVEGGYAVRDDLAAVDRLHDAGVRCLTLTWMEPTPWADAAGADPVHGGLTGFGRDVVERLQRLGILVDVSHAADATTRDVLSRAERPVVASHSACRALADHPRNLPDDLLEGIAGTGGLTGINFFPGYLDTAHGRRFDALRDAGVDPFSPEAREAMEGAAEGLEPVGIARVAEHAAHATGVAGSGAVGLGSDFDGVPTLPAGMSGVEDLPALTRALAGEGVSAGTLRGVLGENFRRVLRGALE